MNGRFILSLNDRAEVREGFQAFGQVPVTTKYTAAVQGSGKSIGELVIHSRSITEVVARMEPHKATLL